MNSNEESNDSNSSFQFPSDSILAKLLQSARQHDQSSVYEVED